MSNLEKKVEHSKFNYSEHRQDISIRNYIYLCPKPERIYTLLIPSLSSHLEKKLAQPSLCFGT